MLSVRLIFTVLATTLICDDSLGGEPNDRTGQVLAEIVRMNKNVIYNRWKFVGRGWAGAYNDEVGKPSTTMKECVEFCQTKRSSDGDAWNAVAWRVPNGHCYCEKNDRGHHEDSEYLHFRAQ